MTSRNIIMLFSTYLGFLTVVTKSIDPFPTNALTSFMDDLLILLFDHSNILFTTNFQHKLSSRNHKWIRFFLKYYIQFVIIISVI